MPEFYVTVARNITKMPEVLRYLPEKNEKNCRLLQHDIFLKIPELFYTIIARKIFSRFFFWGGVGHVPPQFPRLVRLRQEEDLLNYLYRNLGSEERASERWRNLSLE